MKKISIQLITLASAIGFFAACLEDKGYTDIIDSADNKPVVSLFGTENGLYPSAIPISASEDVSVTITAARATTDLKVTLKLDFDAVAKYNAQLAADAIAAGDTLDDGTADFDPFDLFPDSLYTIPSMVVNIPKGTKDVDFTIKVNTSKMSLSDNYILPVVIESVEGDPNAVISDNIKSLLWYIQAKNRFDGHYTVTGEMVDATNAGLVGPYPWDVYLVTQGANQVAIYDNEYTHDLYHKIKSSNGDGTFSDSYYGVFGVLITIGADNKVTSVVNIYGQPASNGRSAELDPSGENVWDPEKKELKVKYWMNQPGPTHRTSFTETFKYVGSRP